jgi:hypothetical protein
MYINNTVIDQMLISIKDCSDKLTLIADEFLIKPTQLSTRGFDNFACILTSEIAAIMSCIYKIQYFINVFTENKFDKESARKFLEIVDDICKDYFKHYKNININDGSVVETLKVFKTDVHIVKFDKANILRWGIDNSKYHIKAVNLVNDLYSITFSESTSLVVDISSLPPIYLVFVGFSEYFKDGDGNAFIFNSPEIAKQTFYDLIIR